MTAVADLIESLTRRGIGLYMAGGNLRINAKKPLSQEDLREIRENKPFLIATLTGKTTGEIAKPVPPVPSHARDVQKTCIDWTEGYGVYFDIDENGLVQVSRWDFERMPDNKPKAIPGNWDLLSPEAVDILDRFIRRWHDVIRSNYAD